MALRQFTFSHPESYAITGVAGTGAFATVCKALCTDRARAVIMGFMEDEEATAMGKPQPTDDVMDVAPDGVEEEVPPEDECFVAIKQLLDYRCQRRVVDEHWATHYLRKVCREVEILHHFRNVPQIIQLGEVYLSADEVDIYLVMPYIERNLRNIIEIVPLEEPLIRWIVAQLLIALDAIHTAGVIHRDLTLANVLVDGNTWDVRLADFGLSRARETDQDVTMDVVTLPYRAPEVLLEYSQYTTAIDIWSLGCVMAELFIRRPFLYVDERKNPDALKQLKLIFKSLTGFPNLNDASQAANQRCVQFLHDWHSQLGGNVPGPVDVGAALQARVPNPLNISDDAIEVLRHMLVFNPHERYTAKQLLQLPWFRADEGCQQLIDYHFAQGPQPKFTTYVESLSFDEMVDLLKRRTQGRRATIDSTVTVPAE